MRSTAIAEVLPPESMTIEQWADMDEDEPGELVDGRLVEEEVPDNLHETVVAWFFQVLKNWGSLHRAVVYGSDHKLAISRTRGRKADVCMYAPGTRLKNLSYSATPPLLIVEVISPRPRDTRRDRSEKLTEYARFGVKFYILVDPRAQLVEVFERSENGLYFRMNTADESKIALPGCEGLELDLDALWAEVAWVIDDETRDEDDSDEPADV